MRSLPFLLIPALAFASPPPTQRRIAVLLVPMDKGAEAMSVKVEEYMIESLKEYSGLSVKTTDDLFGVPDDDEASSALKRAEQGYAEGKAAFEKREYDDAERKLRATIKEYAKAAPAMRTCGHLCESEAMYAAALQNRGDVEEAKNVTLDLISLAPTYELDRKKFPQDYIALRATVATSRSAQLRGNVAIKTRPAGARVYLDGDRQNGNTPSTLQTLQIGKHLLRIERPGFKVYGQIIEVTPEDSEVAIDLVPTSGYKAYDQLLDKLAQEARADKGGATMASIAKTLNLDRGIVVVMKEINEAGGVEMHSGLFDLRSGKKLAMKKANFQGDEYGQLKSEIGRSINQLMTASEGGGEKLVKSADPLDGRHGMEDWNNEDRGGNRTNKEKKKTGDPLNKVDGMDEW